jgi:hypothetical protein
MIDAARIPAESQRALSLAASKQSASGAGTSPCLNLQIQDGGEELDFQMQGIARRAGMVEKLLTPV